MDLDLADAAETITLWPDGPPTVIEAVGDEIAYPAPPGLAAGSTFLRNISNPNLTVFAPRASNGAGVIVIPGGGWTLNAWTNEGVDIARWLTRIGYTAFVLKYRVMATTPDPAAYEAAHLAVDDLHEARLPASRAPRSMQDLASNDEDPFVRAYLQARAAAADDGRRAIEIVRARAKQYSLRPDAIGMIGFSAGAFLAVDLAVEPTDTPLAFVAAIYGGETRGTPVPANAPPLFSLVAQDDRIMFKIVEGLHRDWSDADRPSELHVFAKGRHGFGLVTQGLPVDRWPDLFLDWLRDTGVPATS